MTELEEYNFRCLIEKYQNICINIGMLCELLKPIWSNMLDPITDREILKLGKYGSMLGCNIWVCKTMAPDCIKVSDQEILDAKENKWTSQVPLRLADINNIDRIFNLSAFW